MYRPLSIIIITASLVWLFGFLKKNNFSFSGVVSGFWNELKISFSKLKELKKQSLEVNLQFFKHFFYLSTLFLFILMAISAFVPVLFGSNLSDVFLLAHVTIAPLFSILLAISIILFAHSNKFNKNDIEKLNENKSKLSQKGYLKVAFWLFALFSVSAMLSIILSMFPIFGTEGQVYLLDVHKYSTLILLLLVIFHSGLITVNSKFNFK